MLHLTLSKSLARRRWRNQARISSKGYHPDSTLVDGCPAKELVPAETVLMLHIMGGRKTPKFPSGWVYGLTVTVAAGRVGFWSSNERPLRHTGDAQTVWSSLEVLAEVLFGGRTPGWDP